MTIFLDAGHGGKDSGATGFGRKEKNDTVMLVGKIGHHLVNSGIKVGLTREGDSDVSLEDRAKKANNAGANYFVSIHRNAGGGQGSEVWIHSDNTAVDRELAETIQSALANFFKNRGVKIGMPGSPKNNFAVNRLTKMPSCLVEVGFIDSEIDNNAFSTRIEEIAVEIAKAICHCAKVPYHGDNQTQSPAPAQPTAPPQNQEPNPVAKITIKKGTWNIRKSPSNTATIVATVKGGKVLDYYGIEDGWYKVDRGYIGPRAVK